ncbi:MAG: YihY/virulence factor BrkB family protein [Ignavibacteria bacterium]|nr:YihY/virulence factor BrkB family protein [Ignavibacteria bacterium]
MKNIKSYYDKTLFYIKKLYEKVISEVLWTLSAGVAFNFILSLIPFFLLLLTVVGILLDKYQVASLLSAHINEYVPLPEGIKEKFLNAVINRVNELTSNTLITGLIGVAGFIWTTSSLFSSMRDVLNKVFNYVDDKSIIYGKLKDILFVFVSLILLIITFSITSLVQIFTYYKITIFNINFDLSYFDKIISLFVGYIISFLMFLLMYRNIPHFKTPWKVIFFTSFWAALFFEIFKYLFTFYILNLSNYTKIYGAFTAFVLTFLWIYFISTIFTFSAALGSIYLNKNNYKIIPR